MKKEDYYAKISDTENKYTTTTVDYNTFTKDIAANNTNSKNLVEDSAIAGSINNADLDNKIATFLIKS